MGNECTLVTGFPLVILGLIRRLLCNIHAYIYVKFDAFKYDKATVRVVANFSIVQQRQVFHQSTGTTDDCSFFFVCGGTIRRRHVRPLRNIPILHVSNERENDCGKSRVGLTKEHRLCQSIVKR